MKCNVAAEVKVWVQDNTKDSDLIFTLQGQTIKVSWDFKSFLISRQNNDLSFILIQLEKIMEHPAVYEFSALSQGVQCTKVIWWHS